MLSREKLLPFIHILAHAVEKVFSSQETQFEYDFYYFFNLAIIF